MLDNDVIATTHQVSVMLSFSNLFTSQVALPGTLFFGRTHAVVYPRVHMFICQQRVLEL